MKCSEQTLKRHHKKYLTVMKIKAERDGYNETNKSLPKAKMRKYDAGNQDVTSVLQ